MVGGDGVRSQAGALSLELGPTGAVQRLAVDGREVLAPGWVRPLLRVVAAGGEPEAPREARWSPDGTELTLAYPCGAGVRLRVRAADSHLAFRVAALEGPPLRHLLWGPFGLDLSGDVGETVGVVRAGDMAVGIQALDPFTMGGWPADLPWPGGEAAGPVRPAPQECAAWPAAWGTLLLAHAGPGGLSGDGGGGGIALFAGPAAQALALLGRIEAAEGLPHPTLHGVWAKESPEATASYLIADFGEDDIAELVGRASEAGLRYPYQGNPFRSWGHFELDPRRFPAGPAGLRRCARLAAAAGVRLGLHTLSNFITTADPYVAPVPHPGLQRLGEARLSEAAGPEGDLRVDDPAPFTERGTLGAVVLEREIVQFDGLSDGPPWTLRGCRRGAFGTLAAGHGAETVAARLADHPYRVFLAGAELQGEMADRLGRLLASADIGQISFDGLEGCLCAGLGVAGEARFVLRAFERFGPEVINDASRLGHFAWHMHTRMNWGEPWGAAMREGQSEYRFANQAYFERNLLPHMLGWFLVRLASAQHEATTLDDMEWMLARASGHGAGFGLVADAGVLRGHGQAREILGAVAAWEAARAAGAFRPEQRARLRDARTEWHLEPEAPGRWRLHPVAISGLHLLDAAERQPGQPAGLECTLSNPFGPQTPGFRLRLRAPGGPAEDVEFATAGGRLRCRGRVEPGEYLVYAGGTAARVCDANWRVLRELPVTGSAPVTAGASTVTVASSAACAQPATAEVRFLLRGPGEVVAAAGA